ncbi:MAG: hypothetical protein JWL95_2556 [Gemmatimonadetes bacterium]|nr:hypothetical protein [Gemmatimonadota bacterium]
MGRAESRIVVVGAGFALWTAGKCVCAARWGDVVRLRCYTRPAGASKAICAAVALATGAEVEFREEIPGWAKFLDAAAGVLPGVRGKLAELSELTRDDDVEIVLFQRRVLG